MPSKQVISPDISVLDFAIQLDISGATPSAKFTNLSTQIHAASLAWCMELYSPSGTIVHKGDFAAADVAASWAAPFIVNTGFPKPFNQIEWSGTPYLAKVRVKDSNGNIFELQKSIAVCRPAGNTKDSQNTFGKAAVLIVARCAKSQVYAEDKTNYSYQGISGTPVSKVFKLFFPKDDTGNEPAAKTVNNFNSYLLPVTQSGPGYEYFLTSVFDYDMTDNVSVRVKYIARDIFTLYCHLDISPIACEIQKLQDTIINGKCEDAAAAQSLLNKVTPMLVTAMIGITNPQSGIDSFEVVANIMKLSGWDCNCCPNGMVPLGSTASNDFLFDVQSDGGDADGDVVVDGNTITFLIHDKSYVVNIAGDSESAAFSFEIDNQQYQKTYRLRTDIDTLSTELLANIAANPGLLTTLNGMINTNSGNWKLAVDMSCLDPNQKSCTYSFVTLSLAAVPNALIKELWVNVNGDIFKKTINFLFDKTNAAALQTLLNTLNLGVFTAAYAANVLTIASANNTNDFEKLTYNINSAVDISMAMTKNCSNPVTIDANTVVQKLIDRVCGLILGSVKSGIGFTINKISQIGGAINTDTIGATESAANVIKSLVASYNTLLELVNKIKGLDCTAIQAVFPDGTDDPSVVYGVRGKTCANIPIDVLAITIFKRAQQISTVKAEMCKANASCATAICTPVANMTASLAAGTLTAVITNTGALKYRIGYRPIGELVTPGPLLGVKEIDFTAGATTTTTFAGLVAGTYEVVVIALCASGESASYAATSQVCAKPTAFNVTFDGTNFTISFAAVATKVLLEIDMPNGGINQSVRLIASGNVVFPRPAGVFGLFVFRLRAVCDEANAWYSDPIDPITFDVAELASCPVVTDAAVSAITNAGANFSATKPVGTNVNAFTLRLIRQTDGAISEYTTNNGGPTATWTIAGLNSNTEYAWEILTECTDGQSNAVVGGTFTTQAAGGNNSSITNSSTHVAAPWGIRINGAIIQKGPTLNIAAVANFRIGDYSDCTVEVNVTDLGIQYATLVSNANNYAPSSVSGGWLTFNHVDLTAGMAITLYDAAP